MKNFIKRTIDRIRRKPLLVKPVVSNSVICDGCNDYGYIIVTFGGHSAEMRCLKCDGKSNRNSILNISSQNYGDDGVGLTSEQIDELL